jgi:hypothetical protein
MGLPDCTTDYRIPQEIPSHVRAYSLNFDEVDDLLLGFEHDNVNLKVQNLVGPVF